MSSTRPSSDEFPTSLTTASDDVTAMMSDLFLRHRLRIVEDLWEAVLRQECGQELVDLLNQLRRMCSPEGQATTFTGSEVLQVVEKLDLNEAIRAARAFALYFQLINIVEQHYEQRDQQLQYRMAREGHGQPDPKHERQAYATEEDAGRPEADFLERSLHEAASRREIGTFHWLFPRLKQLNVPPQLIQKLINQLDVWLVFTAHPTEIVRHTIRDKQRRIAKILRQLDSVEDSLKAIGLSSSWETESLRDQLTEEIRLWWRTDELHQFKPTVLDEVDHALHYFREVIFDAIPHLYKRLETAVYGSFPKMQMPRRNFCQFGSWVGADRDGNPSVTPQVTWQTACYQRRLVLERYVHSIQSLSELLSLSLHWSDVLPDLLESLEQ
ncbi:phosphoenolpyruvate carboxylase, partial [Pseudanabaenaceae cyanobacterium LEGE 13415]|nr:phosphoenolpyruvate carboxylase [Pseudanabaenaceae cyanobacterium LEGE 13415]